MSFTRTIGGVSRLHFVLRFAQAHPSSAVFKVLVNLGLRKVGARYSQSAIDDTLDYIEIFYDEETVRINHSLLGVAADFLVRRDGPPMALAPKPSELTTTRAPLRSLTVRSFLFGFMRSADDDSSRYTPLLEARSRD